MPRWLPVLALLALAACTTQIGSGFPTALPQPIAETTPPRPSPGHLWQPGNHDWTGSGYEWRPGRWVSAERPSALWQEGHWAPTDGGYVWVPGRWI